jgi:hypothetical protein
MMSESQAERLIIALEKIAKILEVKQKNDFFK